MVGYAKDRTTKGPACGSAEGVRAKRIIDGGVLPSAGLAVCHCGLMAQQCPPCTARFVEVEAAEDASAHRHQAAGSLCAELLLPGGAVLRVYHLAGGGGRV